MTPVDLVDQLKVFAEEKLENLLLPIRTPPKEDAKYRRPEVFKMNLPDLPSQKEKAPYVVLQFVNGSDEQNDGEEDYSICKIRVVVCAYSDNLGEGSMHVLNMLTRLRTELLRERVLGKRYLLKLPLEYLVYPDNPAPYFFGEMMTVWEIPTIRREIHYE